MPWRYEKTFEGAIMEGLEELPSRTRFHPSTYHLTVPYGF